MVDIVGKLGWAARYYMQLQASDKHVLIASTQHSAWHGGRISVRIIFFWISDWEECEISDISWNVMT
jgi:hypothetical protein